MLFQIWWHLVNTQALVLYTTWVMNFTSQISRYFIQKTGNLLGLNHGDRRVLLLFSMNDIWKHIVCDNFYKPSFTLADPLLGCGFCPLHLCSECLLLLVYCLESIEAGISWWCCSCEATCWAQSGDFAGWRGPWWTKYVKFLRLSSLAHSRYVGFKIVMTYFMWRAFLTIVQMSMTVWVLNMGGLLLTHFILCFLQMITKNFEDYPEHRLKFFSLLRAIASHCFRALFSLSSQVSMSGWH